MVSGSRAVQSHPVTGRKVQKLTSHLTLSSSLPSPGFSHELTSLCRTGPRFCQLVCSVTSAWYCVPAQKDFADMSWSSTEAYSISVALFSSAPPECLGSQLVMQSENQADFWSPPNTSFLLKSTPQRGVPRLSLMKTPLQKGAPHNTVLKKSE